MPLPTALTDVLLNAVMMTKKVQPKRMIVYSNAKDGKQFSTNFHLMKKDKKLGYMHLNNGEENFEKPKHFKACSNHFLEGRPTKCNPDPTSFLKYQQIHCQQ